MDYSKLSDFEINSAVHNALMDEPYEIEFLGGDKIRWVRDDIDVTTGKVEYQKNRLKNYCNNPADAWPIIISALIGLEPIYRGGVEWLAHAGDDSEFRFTDKNPIRAAMIIFLMMQDK